MPDRIPSNAEMAQYSQQKSGLHLCQFFSGPMDGEYRSHYGALPLEIRYGTRTEWFAVYRLVNLELAHYAFAGWAPEGTA